MSREVPRASLAISVRRCDAMRSSPGSSSSACSYSVMARVRSSTVAAVQDAREDSGR